MRVPTIGMAAPMRATIAMAINPAPTNITIAITTLFMTYTSPIDLAEPRPGAVLSMNRVWDRSIKG